MSIKYMTHQARAARKNLRKARRKRKGKRNLKNGR